MVSLDTPVLQVHDLKPAWIVLSYAISFIGVVTTLTALRCRTSSRSVRNWVLLSVAGISMGFVSVFCMHLSGTRAIHLRNADSNRQFHHRPWIMVASALQPVVLFSLVFALVDSVESVRLKWFRTITGGTLASASILGMHYTCQAAIDNYEIHIRVYFAIGAALLTLVGFNTVLVVFFYYRNKWAKSWRNLLICALSLSTILTSGHFCAICGLTVFTNLKSSEMIRNFDPILFGLLGAAIFICASFLLYAIVQANGFAHGQESMAEVHLYCAIFDSDGNILVDERHGTLPCQAITGLENNPQLTTTSALFQWMYRVSKNWAAIEKVLPSMLERVCAQNTATDVKPGNALRDESALAPEQYCIAARRLADSLGVSLTTIGSCFDEVIQTGTLGISTSDVLADAQTEPSMLERGSSRCSDKEAELGQAIFLVKQATSEESLHFSTRGYTFISIETACQDIADILHLPPSNALKSLQRLQRHRNLKSHLSPGFHIAFLSMQTDSAGEARILVPSQCSTAILPTAFVQQEHLTASNLLFLQEHYQLTIRELSQACSATVDESQVSSRRSSALLMEEFKIARRQSAFDLADLKLSRRQSALLAQGVVPMRRQVSVPQELLHGRQEASTFASRLYSAIETLDSSVGRGEFLSARFIPRLFTLPCTGQDVGKFAHFAVFRLDNHVWPAKDDQKLEWIMFETFNSEIVTQTAHLNDAFLKSLNDEFPQGQEMPDASYFDKKTVTQEVQINVTEIASPSLGLASPLPVSPGGQESQIEEIVDSSQKFTWVEEALLRSDAIFR